MRLWQPCTMSPEYCHYSIAKIIKNTLYRYNHAELFSFFFCIRVSAAFSILQKAGMERLCWGVLLRSPTLPKLSIRSWTAGTRRCPWFLLSCRVWSSWPRWGSCRQ